MMSTQLSDAASDTDVTGTTRNEHEDVHVEIEHITEDTGLDSGENSIDIRVGDSSIYDHAVIDDGGIDGSTAVISDGGGGVDGSSDVIVSHQQQYSTPLSNGKIHLYNRVQGKRTVILPHQRKILEEFYRTGMTSASYNLHHLHEAAADQTGLELYVIKNWVRNRRRPSAAQKRQDLTTSQIMNQLIHPTVSAFPNVTFPTVTTVTVPTPQHAYSSSLVIPESKRQCLEDTASSDNSCELTVRVRIADSGETDFVEVDVKELTYLSLLKCCCEELEVPLQEVLKLRKLPNILIRKDKDVSRLGHGQELEMVLRSNASVPQAVMTFSPFQSSSSAVQLINVNPLMTSENGLLPPENHSLESSSHS